MDPRFIFKAATVVALSTLLVGASSAQRSPIANLNNLVPSVSRSIGRSFAYTSQVYGTQDERVPLVEIAAHPGTFSDSARIDRVRQFIDRLANEIPRLVNIQNPAQLRIDENKRDVNALTVLMKLSYASPRQREQTSIKVASLRSLEWLDSLGVLWGSSNARVRAAWLLGPGYWSGANGEDGIGVISRTLLSAHGQQALIPQLNRLSTVTLQAANINSEPWVTGVLRAAGYILKGYISLSKGDTTGAVSALFKVARTPVSASALVASETIIDLAAAQRDTLSWVLGLTLAYLETPVLPKKNRYYTKLQQLFNKVYANHNIAPDVIPEVAQRSATTRHQINLDSYLDRQFDVLYDRSFPVSLVRKKPSAKSTSSRLVVIEYSTGLLCSSCWSEDRALDAVLRRYSPDDVVTLAYHDPGLPVANLADSLAGRLYAWYPSPVGRYAGFRNNDLPPVIPAKTLLAGNGDALNTSLIWIDGVRIPRTKYLSYERGPPGHRLYQSAILQIDQRLQTAPQAVVKISFDMKRDSLRVSVLVDSIQGRHERLALRIALIEDTVRVRGATIRRMYYNVVRAIADSPGFSLGIPVSSPSVIRYNFNIRSLMRQKVAQSNPDMGAEYIRPAGDVPKTVIRDIGVYRRYYKDNFSDRFPDESDWKINPSRLQVVAFLQDINTSEVLQAARVKLPDITMTDSASEIGVRNKLATPVSNVSLSTGPSSDRTTAQHAQSSDALAP